MGQEIARSSFSEEEHAEFHRRLREETKVLKRWFDERAFDYDETPTTGLEMEAWLLDENHLPAPMNDAFLAAANHPQLVHELSKFNFEMNADPQTLAGDFLDRTQAGLETLWTRAGDVAKAMKLKPMAIGILPTVRDEMLQPDWMSTSERYRALQQELFRLRHGESLHIDIEGEDALDYRCDHLMLEAACTSLQGHLKVNQEDAVRMYNASVMAAAPIVAATANAPFLYGKSLWAETRIPAFEQATAIHGMRDVDGRDILRVTLGTGYLRHSMLELFVENLGYPALLPALDDDAAKLPHLRLQNGTIWRWNRPIVGFDGKGKPHLRIEHRVMPAGPTIADSIANLALFFGLTLALAKAETAPEEDTPFEDARQNLYACARHGLDATVRWMGKDVGVQALLLDRLLDQAKAALAKAGAGAPSLHKYFEEILRPRLRSGQTGAAWQRSFIDCNGKNFQALTERYAELQATGAPVHAWKV